MRSRTTRFTLDLNDEYRLRLKIACARQNMTMRRYCLEAIEKQMHRDDVADVKTLPFGEEAVKRLSALVKQTFPEYDLMARPQKAAADTAKEE